MNKRFPAIVFFIFTSIISISQAYADQCGNVYGEKLKALSEKTAGNDAIETFCRGDAKFKALTGIEYLLLGVPDGWTKKGIAIEEILYVDGIECEQQAAFLTMLDNYVRAFNEQMVKCLESRERCCPAASHQQTAAGNADGEAPVRCGALPLLAIYEKAGMLQRTPDGTISLRLVANVHTADCGAPDCYGTNIAVTVKPDAGESGCVISDVLMDATDYFETDCGPSEPAEEHRRDVYVPDGGPADLGAPSLKKLTLRTQDGTRALVLLPDSFFYFNNVTRGGVLRTRLPNENDNEENCCWGATSNMKEGDL